MTRRRLLPLLLLPVLAAAESPLEISHPGEPLLAMDALNLSLGGAGEARWNVRSGLPANPALLAGLDGVTFSTVLQFRQARRDTSGGLWTENRQDFPAFQFTLALPAGWRLGLGYRSLLRNRGSYLLSQTMAELPEDEEDWDGSYDLYLDQQGGIGAFPLSLAWQAHERLRLGLAVSLLRGSLEQEWEYDFPDGSGLYDRKVRRRADWHGTALDLGLQARLSGSLALSLLYRGSSALSGTDLLEIAGQTDTEEETLAGRHPSSLAAGLSWAPYERLVLSLAWERQPWSDYESPVQSEALYDVNRYSAGLAWKWVRPRRGLRPARVLPLRLGMRYGHLPGSDPIGGGRVRELLYSLGTGFSVQEGKGSVDVALFLQNLDAGGGASERRWGLALSLRTSEPWKRRTLPY